MTEANRRTASAARTVMFDPGVVRAFVDRYRGTLVATLGFGLTAHRDGELEARWIVGRRHRNAQHVLHGGMSIYLAETLSSFGSWYLLPDKTAQHVACVSVASTHLHAGAIGDELTMRATLLRAGSKLDFWSTQVLRPNGVLVNSTQTVIAITGTALTEPRPAPSR